MSETEIIRIRKDTFLAMNPFYQALAAVLMDRGEVELIEDRQQPQEASA